MQATENIAKMDYETGTFKYKTQAPKSVSETQSK